MKVVQGEQMEIGGVRLSVEGGVLTLHGTVEAGSGIQLDGRHVVELMCFLRSIILKPTDPRRRADRVRVPGARGFRATVHAGATAYAVEPRDLSLTGIRVHMDQHDGTCFEEGATVRVTLDYDETCVIADSKIVWRSGNEYGLAFVNPGSGGPFDPLAGIARLIMQLERFWTLEAWTR